MLINYRKDGSPWWNLLSITPLRNCAQEIIAFLGVQKDVTDLVRRALSLYLRASSVLLLRP
jgi:PAS domain S-box-containing protein